MVSWDISARRVVPNGKALNELKDIVKYFQEVGSSNPKHLDKFVKYFQNKYGEVPKWS